MDTVRKVGENGTIYLNPQQQAWLDVKVGDYVILRDETGAKGQYLSLFKPTQPHHKKLVEENNK